MQQTKIKADIKKIVFFIYQYLKSKYIKIIDCKKLKQITTSNVS